MAFRDYLKKNEPSKNQLMELKRELGMTCHSKEEYMEKKDALVQEITKRALEVYDCKMKKSLLSVKIETPRLILIPIRYKFEEEIFRNFNDEITLYMIPKPAKEIEETRQFIASSIEGLRDGSNLQLIILKKDSSEFIGCVGIHHLKSKTPVLGIWTKKDSHRHGYGLESITAIISWAKDNIEFDYLIYQVDKRNYPSKRIPEINGGIAAKELKKINQKGFELDEIEYRIYKDIK